MEEMQKKAYLGNAFTLNMLREDVDFALVRVKKVEPHEVPADAISVIGHADTARVIGNILGREVVPNRCNVTLTPKEVLYVAQYRGPRLPEGATELPEGAKLTFYKVDISKGCSECTCNSEGCTHCAMHLFYSGCGDVDE